MQAQEYANLLSAWQSGGEVDGEPVTDKMFMGYVRGRMDEYAKGSPLYDKWKLQYDQLDYGINESKQATLYAQGKIGDRQMAQFYLNWAKKVPKDSEFYRTLQKDAARFMQAAAARGRAGAASARAEAFNSYYNTVNDQYLALGNTLTGYMTQIARNNNLIGSDQDLSDFMLKGQNDPGRMQGLLRMLNTDMDANPAAYASLIADIKKYDPGWDGNLTADYYANALKSQVTGYNLLTARALKDGYTGQAKDAAKAADSAVRLGAQAASWPVAESYSMAREQFEAIYESPAATALDKSQAAEKFAKQIDTFSATPGLEPAMANRLRNDALALRGDPGAANQPSFYENYLGKQSLTAGTESTTTGKTSGENVRFQQENAARNFRQNLLAAYPGQFVYAASKQDPMGNLVYDETGEGDVDIVPIASVVAAPGETTLVPVPTISGSAVVQAVGVQAVVTDDGSGRQQTVGKVAKYMQGANAVQIYMYEATDENGNTEQRWTPVAPWAAGTREEWGKDGKLHLTAAPLDPTAAAAEIDRTYGTNLANDLKAGVLSPGWSTTVKGARPAAKDAGTFADVEITWNGTTFELSRTTTIKNVDGTSKVTKEPVTVAPQAAAMDTSRMQADANPQIDFEIPAMAGLAATKASGDSVVATWNTPQFQSLLYQQIQQYAGNDPQKMYDLDRRARLLVRNLASIGGDVESLEGRRLRRTPDRDELLIPSLLTRPKYGPPAPTVKVGGRIVVPKNPLEAGARGVEMREGVRRAPGIRGVASATDIFVTQAGFAVPAPAAPTVAPVMPTVTPKPTPTPTPTPIAPKPVTVAPTTTTTKPVEINADYYVPTPSNLPKSGRAVAF